MARKKLFRFQHNVEANNVFEVGKDNYDSMAGNWHSQYFQNSNPIVVELGCGRGEYTVGLARVFPDKNFIGVDIKGDRIAVGSQQAIQENLMNVAFLRTRIQEIHRFFQTGEVSEIWITFPDPRPKSGDEKRRLTAPRFLVMYAQMIKKGGFLHLKTDSQPFFDYSLASLTAFGATIITETKDLYTSPYHEEHLGIKTKYEGIFSAKGFKINYLKCVLK
ncbi:MAG: tRNA (guanosine(46)-N7)-methyltransferase TrmB [Spirosomataceae bacterium]